MGETNNCKNCETVLTIEAKFCNACGQKVITERFVVRDLFTQMFSIITNVEKGFWYTIKMMFLAPEQVIRDYWNGKTVQYYSPVRFIFILASISILLSLQTGLYESQMGQWNSMVTPDQTPEELARQEQAMKFVKTYMNLVILFVIPFFSLSTWRFYKKQGDNYAEHLIANCFIFGQTTVIGMIPMIFYFTIPSTLVYAVPISMSISILYYSYVYSKLYKVGYLKATIISALSIVFGYITMFLFTMILTIIVVLIYIAIKKLFF